MGSFVPLYVINLHFDVSRFVNFTLKIQVQFLHILVGDVDAGLKGYFRLSRPHWNNMARISWRVKYHNQPIYSEMCLLWNRCQMEGHVPKRYVCLSIMVGNVSYWSKVARNSCFVCRTQQTKPFVFYMFRRRRQAWDLSGQSHHIPLYSTNISIMRSAVDCMNLLLISLLGFGFAFRKFASPWFPVFGKSR